MSRPQLYHHLLESSDEEEHDRYATTPYVYCPRLDKLGLRPPLGLEEPKPHLLSLVVIRLLPIGAAVSWVSLRPFRPRRSLISPEQLSTLLLLLFSWIHLDQQVQYRWYLGSVPYLSNVGAEHPRFFQFGCSATAIFFVASLCAERILRSTRVMVEATEERLLWVSVGVVDTVVGALGGMSLVLVSVYDCVAHPYLHNVFMSSFIISVAVTGTLQTVETEHLWHEQ